MYKTFFGLRENPFNVNPDPRFLYLTPQTRAAMDELTYGIQNRKGFILLTGEVGTGKTTLINYLLNWLRARKTPTAFIFNSHLSANHLFDFILTDFGIPVDYRLNNNMLMRLNTWLIERFRAGETPVLIIDEAQGLSSELLEEIRLLLNLETASEKLLQIVLAGQPELEQKLRRPELRQLQQRITLRCNTGAMSLAETHGYVAERLRIAGATGAPIFASEAMDAVYFYSQGIPRVINLLCEHALINAYVEHSRLVLTRMVDDAAHEFLLDEDKPVSIRRNSGEMVNSNLAVMHTIFATGLNSSPGLEKMKEPAPAQAAVPVTPQVEVRTFVPNDAVFASGSVGLRATGNGGAKVQLGEASRASTEKANERLAAHKLMPAMATPDKKQKAQALHVDSKVDAAGVTDAHAADKRSQARVLPIPTAPVSQPKIEHAQAAGAGMAIAIAEKRTVTPAGVNQVADKVSHTRVHAAAAGKTPQSPLRRNGSIDMVVLDKWSRMSHAVLLKILSSMLLFRTVLRCWVLEFKRDWVVMIKTTPLLGMRESFLRWLCQPIRATLWRPAKVTTLQPRRNVVP